MGQAFDRDGKVLGEAFGATKAEVFKQLDREFKDAFEIRVRSLRDAAHAEGVSDPVTSDQADGAGGERHTDSDASG